MFFNNKNIEYFIPLKKFVNISELESLTLSEELSKVFNRNIIIQEIFEYGFLDPNIPNSIRIKDKVLILNDKQIKNILNIEEYKKCKNFYLFDKILSLEELKKIEISKEVQNFFKGKDFFEEICNFGYSDENIKDAIIYKDKVIIIENNVFSKIINFNKYINKKGLRFLYNIDGITIDSNLTKENGFDLKWIIFDIKNNKINFEIIEENIVIIETINFIYKINNNKIEKILNKEKEEIEKIEWDENGCILINNTKGIYEIIYNDVFKWFSYIQNSKFYKMYYKHMERTKDFEELFGNNFIYNPEILKKIKNYDNDKKNLLIQIFLKDITNNGTFIKEKNTFITGWFFKYKIKGIAIEDIFLPDGSIVNCIEISKDKITINYMYSFDINLQNLRPKKLLDLHEGNFVKILPRNIINKYDMIDHAIKRYNQRISQKDFLCEMLYFMLDDIYNNGKIIEGAYFKDRRKIKTNIFEYILDDKNIISVWPIEKIKPIRKQNKYLKYNSTIKRINKIKDILKIIYPQN